MRLNAHQFTNSSEGRSLKVSNRVVMLLTESTKPRTDAPRNDCFRESIWPCYADMEARSEENHTRNMLSSVVEMTSTPETQ